MQKLEPILRAIIISLEKSSETKKGIVLNKGTEHEKRITYDSMIEVANNLYLYTTAVDGKFIGNCYQCKLFSLNKTNEFASHFYGKCGRDGSMKVLYDGCYNIIFKKGEDR